MDCNDKNFNPFYDSKFLISHEGSDERRLLVELYAEELIDLRNEIDIVLQGRGEPEIDANQVERKILKSQTVEEINEALSNVDILTAKNVIKLLFCRLNMLGLFKTLEVSNEDFDLAKRVLLRQSDCDNTSFLKDKRNV